MPKTMINKFKSPKNIVFLIMNGGQNGARILRSLQEKSRNEKPKRVKN